MLILRIKWRLVRTFFGRRKALLKALKISIFRSVLQTKSGFEMTLKQASFKLFFVPFEGPFPRQNIASKRLISDLFCP